MRGFSARSFGRFFSDLTVLSSAGSDDEYQDSTLSRLQLQAAEYFPIQSQVGVASSFVANERSATLPRPPRNCGQRPTTIRSSSLQDDDIVLDPIRPVEPVVSINASTSMNDIPLSADAAASTPNAPGTSSLDRPDCEIGALTIADRPPYYVPILRFDEAGTSNNYPAVVSTGRSAGS